MNDPQVWTLIAVFVGLQALVLRQVGAIESKLETRIEALAHEMRAGFAAVDRRFEEVDRRFEEVDRRFEEQDVRGRERFAHLAELMSARFSALEHRVSALEEDMKLVKTHLIPPAA